MKLFRHSFAFLALLTLAASTASCSKGSAQTVLNVEQTACIIANQWFPAPEVTELCGIVQDATPVIEKLITDLRAKSAQPPPACAKDNSCHVKR
jgi:hypothetical protein